jgi:hypothetical protein
MMKGMHFHPRGLLLPPPASLSDASPPTTSRAAAMSLEENWSGATSKRSMSQSRRLRAANTQLYTGGS